MLKLAYEVADKSGAYTIAYNAANEIAVPLFLEGKILFTDIPKITNEVISMNWSTEPVTIDDVFLFDNQARIKAKEVADKIMEGSF